MMSFMSITKLTSQRVESFGMTLSLQKANMTNRENVNNSNAANDNT